MYKIYPYKCYPPQILLSTLYIDMYSYGLENTLKDMSNIYSGEIDNCNFRGARVSRVLTPQFPFEATIKNNFERLEIIIG